MSRSMTEHVGVGPLADDAAVAEARRAGPERPVSMWIASSIGRRLLLADRLLEQAGRVAEGGDHVEVGAGVGRADQAAGIAPDPEPGFPVRRRSARRSSD